MDVFVNKTIRKTGEELEPESTVRFEVGPTEISPADLSSLKSSVNSGALAFIQPQNSFKRLVRAINNALYGAMVFLSPLRSIDGSETVSLDDVKGDTLIRYVEIAIPGARPSMCAVINPPVELIAEITAIWPAIVDDDLVRIYYEPKASMGAMNVAVRVRVLK